MSMQRYEQYIDSGIEWLGEIPAHWELKRLGSWFKERRTKVSDKDFEPLSVTKNGILPQLESAAKSNDGDNRKLVLRGDYVINSRSDRKGSSGLSNLDGSVSLINIVITPLYINPEFCQFLFKSDAFVEEFYRNGHGIVADLWTTRFDEMKNIYIVFPPIQEQEAIAKFVDTKCGQIDRAIAQKERVIELLNERRQIIIQRAVTRGLNSDVELKDSGIDWIGEIPKNWEMKPLKYIANLESGNTISPDQILVKGKYPVYGGNGFRGYTTTYTNNGYYPLIGRQGALCGNVNYARGQFYASEHAIVVYPLNNENVLWLGELIKIANLNRYSQSAAQPGIAVSIIKNILFPYAPISEQQEIANYLDNISEKIDKAISIKKEEIAKLKEYKQTLINSAVTGKIKIA